jgi:hypothetical protein
MLRVLVLEQSRSAHGPRSEAVAGGPLMARIRSIKPEFWTSQQIVECSTNARLLFIGLWNFCDDNGIHPAEPRRLKMEIFPGDDFMVEQITGWIGELLKVGLLREYETEGQRYWLVTGWKKHQKIDKPSYKHPLPPATDSAKAQGEIDEHSPNDRRGLDDRSPPESSGVESSGVELSTPDGVDVRSEAADQPEPRNGKRHDATPPCPHEQIIDLYHEILPMCPVVREWNKTREGFLRARWREKAERQSLNWWCKFFMYVADSKFLTGQTEPRNGQPPFIADLEWLTRPTNFAKVIEGKYKNRGAA